MFYLLLHDPSHTTMSHPELKVLVLGMSHYSSILRGFSVEKEREREREFD